MTDNTIVVAHRIPSAVTPLGEWLGEVADRVVLITSKEAADEYARAFPEVIGVADYSGSDEVVERLDELCRTRNVTRIVYGTEDDILRLARVRTRYGIAGLGEAQALPYRDKALMKDAVREAVRTPSYLVPPGPDEAASFAARTGWPVVVKPRLGYGSRGVVVATSEAMLRAEVEARPADDVLLEEFVPGDVYHVDGFMRDGEVVLSQPSRYLNGCLAFQEGRPLGSVQLDADDPVARAFETFVPAVIGALPPTELTPFHLEAFLHEATGELYFCEIAARLGGAHVFETLTQVTGVNPVRTWYRHQVGLVEEPRFRHGTDRYGWLLVPPQAGTLDAIHDLPLPEGVVQYRANFQPPHSFDGAHASTDAVVSFVVGGESSQHVERSLRSCIRWAAEALRWTTS
ncbi:carboxylate--amine ligase [Planotetraspora thailandica]|uniref:Carboxylate--amine ligase n=1 Tax=Planotetraspora thailandica TaxID=487172 RepID=A0A8J3V0E8_9ACTN|nr:ATP-grasp domain-containing protein [Planotetraspora thailandica]GII52756.1 carboxylate--amine ligase [Planotetraspora thailandica]